MQGWVEGTGSVEVVRYMQDAHRELERMARLGDVSAIVSFLLHFAREASGKEIVKFDNFKNTFGFSDVEITSLLVDGHREKAFAEAAMIAQSPSKVTGENYLHIQAAEYHANEARFFKPGSEINYGKALQERYPDFRFQEAVRSDYQNLVSMAFGNVPENIRVCAALLFQLPHYSNYDVVATAVRIVRETTETDRAAVLEAYNQLSGHSLDSWVAINDVLSDHMAAAHGRRAEELELQRPPVSFGFAADYHDALVAFHREQADSACPDTAVDFKKASLRVFFSPDRVMVECVPPRSGSGEWARRLQHASYAA